MTLLEVRCKVCRRVLRQLTRVPDDWSGTFRYEACRRHGRQYQRRHEARAAADADARVLGTGPLLVDVPYATFRAEIERAARTGRTYVTTV